MDKTKQILIHRKRADIEILTRTIGLEVIEGTKSNRGDIGIMGKVRDLAKKAIEWENEVTELENIELQKGN